MITRPSGVLKHAMIGGPNGADKRLGQLWWKAVWGWRPYAEFQRRHMDRRGREDPKEAVGGMWDVVGPFQLAYLRTAGLKPHHSLLDIGCGSLRGGLHIIRYLEPGKYTGTDISPELLKAAHRFLAQDSLADKSPRLNLVKDFRFREVAGQKFDFIQAFGVFTDIPKGLVGECLSNLAGLMAPGGVFYATFAHSPVYRPNPAAKSFWYPGPMLKEMAEARGFTANLVPSFNTIHPKGHSLIELRFPQSRPTADDADQK